MSTEADEGGCGKASCSKRGLRFCGLKILQCFLALQYMAQYFALDIVSHAIMSNHFHIILRNRPDVVKTWSASRVAEHWLRLYPKDRDQQGKPSPPKPAQIRALAKDKKRIAKLRQRLSSISWFHAYLKEKIARQSNAEEDVTGAF